MNTLSINQTVNPPLDPPLDPHEDQPVRPPIRRCKQCGVVLAPHPKQRGARPKYCSDACRKSERHKTVKDYVLKNCAHCTILFRYNKSKVKKPPKFCTTCRKTSVSLYRTCPHCEKEFMRPKNTPGAIKFCPECRKIPYTELATAHETKMETQCVKCKGQFTWKVKKLARPPIVCPECIASPRPLRGRRYAHDYAT